MSIYEQKKLDASKNKTKLKSTTNFYFHFWKKRLEIILMELAQLVGRKASNRLFETLKSKVLLEHLMN